MILLPPCREQGRISGAAISPVLGHIEMANKMLRSEFLGQTLERGAQLVPSKLPVQKQVQALLGKSTQKKAKLAPQKAASGLKGLAQKAKKAAPKQAPKGPSLPKPPSLGSLPSPKKAQKQVQRNLPKGGGRGSKGWFGGVGGVSGQKGLGKYYGTYRNIVACLSAVPVEPALKENF